MNHFPYEQESYNQAEPPIFPPYYYQPIVYQQPQLFLRQRMSGPKLATTLRQVQKGVTTATKLIPLIYQIQPMISNAKNVLNVAKAIKSVNSMENNENDTNNS